MSITLDGDNLATNGVLNSKTAVASTSGTAIDFTGIPAGVKRITVMFNGVSTNGSSNYQVQIGSGSVTTSGYAASAAYTGASAQGYTATTGVCFVPATAAANSFTGSAVLTNISSNTWVASSNFGRNDGYQMISSGSITLSGTLDRVRITTVNGTDTFDAGSINILYE